MPTPKKITITMDDGTEVVAYTDTPATTLVKNPDGSAEKRTIETDGSVTTVAIPKGMILAGDNVALEPVTPAVAWDACKARSAGLAGFVQGLSWNALEWLRRKTPVELADWCAEAAKLPDLAGTAQTVGWITNLSYNGAGFFLSLANAVSIPNTDPRPAAAPAAP